MKDLIKLKTLKDNGIKISSEKTDKGTRIVIYRGSKRSFGSKVYHTPEALGEGFRNAINYEFNKIYNN